MKKTNPLTLFGIGLALYSIGKKAINKSYLEGKVVLVTGGSKGLGYILANSLAKEGCKVAICARDQQELDRALAQIKLTGAQAMAIKCDVAETKEVREMVAQVIERFGRLDILVNNAGIIQVGAMESFRHQDYEKAMDVMYWGMANTTFAAMKRMKEQGRGHIVNITSVGGKVSVPHLLPYSASKFAAVGFSEGITAELAKDNIHVTTIIPGLMRTGSFMNAQFNKGDSRELKIFSFMSSAPFLTLNAQRAAAKIVKAIREKQTYKVLGIQAKAIIQMHNLFPTLTAKMFGLVNRVMPRTESDTMEAGLDIEKREKGKHFGFGPMADRARENFQDLNP